MKLTEELKKEFIISLKRLNNSMEEIMSSECYDYNKIVEIHKTYLEYCKVFLSIDEYCSVPVNLEIKYPKLFFKANWSGNATLKETIIFGKYTRRNFSFEKDVNYMFKEIKLNLELISLSLNNCSDLKYINELKKQISSQPKEYKVKKSKERKKTNFLIITCVVAFVIYQLCLTDLRFVFQKTEIGHAFSYVINLNKFEINVFQKDKKEYEIYWNDYIIYRDGKLIYSNINKTRYAYGNNVFKVCKGNSLKTFNFYKENNWDYHKFEINLQNEEPLIWIDGKIMIE